MIGRLPMLVVAFAIGAAPAAAVELVGPPLQPNLSNETGSSFPNIVPDADGGFAALWDVDIDGDLRSDQILARFYGRDRQPKGAARRIDGKIGGRTPTNVFGAGGALLGDGRQLYAWQADFAQQLWEKRQFVGRFIGGRAPGDEISRLETDPDMVAGAPPLPLRDGRAILRWQAFALSDREEGRFVSADGSLGPANLVFQLANARISGLAALDKGFVALFVRSLSSGEEELVGQVYGAEGGRQGGVIVVVPPSPAGTLGATSIVGLPSGDFFLLRAVRRANGSARLTGQRFTRTGRRIGGEKTLLNSIPFQAAAPRLLPGGDLLIALEERVGETKCIVYRRFGDDLEQIGPAAATDSAAGLIRGPSVVLADGRVASAYVIGRKIFVQVVAP
ncbi:hypothetical protein [Hansschlegelia zhihuaiae]|uniref:Phytase-like domain-containing protein n=1 Tax=Hansschlegelia zhihuaiae TaxID=405005 RepID=A0A4V1KJF9_9HYPH|nr:hypothetical protein [Hansschlegelia zhihuaiae]RXF74052.1 hypothetical protein EK403_06675 [Hansschlegelia zhihuaiae]